MSTDLGHLPFLNLLKRGTTMDISAESFSYWTSTEILDCDPDESGGVLLTLDGTIDDGGLWLTAAMIAAAEHNGDCWEVSHEGILFRFGVTEDDHDDQSDDSTISAEEWEEHGRAIRERDAIREAKRIEQERRV